MATKLIKPDNIVPQPAQLNGSKSTLMCWLYAFKAVTFLSIALSLILFFVDAYHRGLADADTVYILVFLVSLSFYDFINFEFHLIQLSQRDRDFAYDIAKAHVKIANIIGGPIVALITIISIPFIIILAITTPLTLTALLLTGAYLLAG